MSCLLSDTLIPGLISPDRWCSDVEPGNKPLYLDPFRQGLLCRRLVRLVDLKQGVSMSQLSGGS